MLTIHPYLNFDGNCKEAFDFYATLFGGQLECRRSASRRWPIKRQPEAKDRVMHARLTADNLLLMGSDALPNQYQKPQGFMITIDVDDAPTAEGVFNKLTDGGSVVMPIQETFWAERFGMCVDRFGIPWMVNSMKPVAATR